MYETARPPPPISRCRATSILPSFSTWRDKLRTVRRRLIAASTKCIIFSTLMSYGSFCCLLKKKNMAKRAYFNFFVYNRLFIFWIILQPKITYSTFRYFFAYRTRPLKNLNIKNNLLIDRLHLFLYNININPQSVIDGYRKIKSFIINWILCLKLEFYNFTVFCKKMLYDKGDIVREYEYVIETT